MLDELQIEPLDEWPPFPPRQTKKGQCKYPFGSLADAGKAFKVMNRDVTTVRQALKRWRRTNPSDAAISVREIDGAVIVRRDK